MPITLEKALELQQDPNNLRNICILAHVDHGKTSISDYLIATNGIISPKTCGTLRYLDARPDEQERGITMEASAVSLYFSLVNPDESKKDYLINLIDCPGHVDFSTEVSAASQLCDGALIIVDVVEGVCSQTHTALHQVWQERLQAVLVLNKMDRLINELKYTPLEAYLHLDKLIQNVNAITGEFYQKACAEGELRHSEIVFSPVMGNVVFTSATQGWGCQIDYFAYVFAAKLKLDVNQLLPWMWGEHYFDPKTKKILATKQLNGRDLKPLAVHLVFDNLWSLYEACGLGVLANPPDQLQMQKIESIAQKLRLKLHPRDLKKSPEQVISLLLSQWLPLSKSLLVPIVKQLPSPKVAQLERLPTLFPALDKCSFGKDVHQCNERSATVYGYFAKMIALPRSALPALSLKDSSISSEEEESPNHEVNYVDPNLLPSKKNYAESEFENEQTSFPFNKSTMNNDVLVGIVRLFCGKIHQGDRLYLLGPKHNPDSCESYLELSIDALFLWLGNDVILVPQVTAGQVFGFFSHDLQICLFKCGTLSSNLACPLLTQFTSWVPMLKVAIEPARFSDMNALIQGLKLLNQSDPAVEVKITSSGEHVLSVAGEVHLERCLYDLRERFAKCEIQVSEPMVPFRETVLANTVDSPPVLSTNQDHPPGETLVSTSTQVFSIKCQPLPKLIEVFLLKESSYSKSKDLQLTDAWLSKLQNVVNQCNDDLLFPPYWASCVRQRGSSSSPANLLWSPIILPPDMITAFHLAIAQGPLAHEPMQGILWTVELADDSSSQDCIESDIASMNLSVNESQSEMNVGQCISPSEENEPGTMLTLKNEGSGRWVTQFKQAFLSTFSSLPMRFILAMYQMQIRCQYQVLGSVYHWIQKRQGKVISEQAMEGSPFFLINLEMPMAHSFQFVKELGMVTSGSAFLQVTGTCWSILLEDPLTREEPDTADAEENNAKKYYLQLRKRKGLHVETKLVEHGEKQRTLMRK